MIHGSCRMVCLRTMLIVNINKYRRKTLSKFSAYLPREFAKTLAISAALCYNNKADATRYAKILRGCGCAPGIRSEHVPLDGRIEIMHCVCEKLRNRRLRLKASGLSSYGQLCQESRCSQVVCLFAYNRRDTLCLSHSVSPMQDILQSGFFIDFVYREHAVRL